MYRYISYFILLVPLLLLSEERIFVSFENEEGKAINKIHYIVSGSRQGIISENDLNISLLWVIIPGRDYFTIKEDFNKWLKYEDLTISFFYEKKDIKLESRLPFKKNWFKNGFTDQGIKIQKKKIPTNVDIEDESYPYRFKIKMGKKRYHIKGHISNTMLDDAIENVEVKLGDKYRGKIISNYDKTGINGNFELTLDINNTPTTDPYMVLRKAGFDINFQTINLDKLLDKDTLYMNIKLYPEEGSGCQFMQECIDKMVWNEDCCQCVCKNPDLNMFYKEYKICAKRECVGDDIMQFKLDQNGYYYQECNPNPLGNNNITEDLILGEVTSNDSLIKTSLTDCEKIDLLKQYINTCSGELPDEFIINNNASACHWCDLLCASEDETDCDEKYRNIGILGIITEYLSMKIGQIEDNEFYEMLENNELDIYSFDFLNLLYQSMDYLGRIPDAYEGVTDAEMANIYLGRANYYLWFADKIYKKDDIYNYYEFRFLEQMKVGEFCNAYKELLNTDPIRAELVLKKIITYGLDAYNQYDYYCASSGNTCQVINEQVTKLKRILDEVKY